MKKNIFIYTLIISLVFFVCSIVIVAEEQGGRAEPVSPTGHAISGNQWLFVIGIDSYTNFQRLNTSVNDAKAVKDILLKRYHFDEYHVILIFQLDKQKH